MPCARKRRRAAKRAFVLPVAVPSHTPLLDEATEQFRAVLREASPRLPRAGYRLLSGIDGDTVGDIETGTDKLARQISTTIDWAGLPRELPIGRRRGGFGTRPRDDIEPYGVGALSGRTRPRSGGISHAGGTPGMAATGRRVRHRHLIDPKVRFAELRPPRPRSATPPRALSSRPWRQTRRSPSDRSARPIGGNRGPCPARSGARRRGCFSPCPRRR